MLFRLRSLSTLMAAASLWACGQQPECPVDDRTDRCLQALGERYIDDGPFRREQALSSFANPDNLYSKQRIAAYGLGEKGWDLLPEWNPVSAVVDAHIADELSTGKPVRVPRDTGPVWDGATPTNLKAWVALGREVFFRYPIRDDAFVEHALRTSRNTANTGLLQRTDGKVPGAVVYFDVDGSERLGITCALCHSSLRGKALVEGAARRGLDYGAMRVALFDDRQQPLAESERQRMLAWGPGRADITEDENGDPVAIPDLWGLREQTALTQSGAILHLSPVALAVRQETQYLHANHQRARPPRELAWALAMYLYSLEAPKSAERPADTGGAELFEQHCSTCHSNAAYGGAPVDVAWVGTDPRLALGKARGTGKYRPPALLNVVDAAPYLHDGSVPSLEDLLGRERFAPSYSGSPLGPGPVAGHAFGVDLSPLQRAQLVEWLRSL